MSDIQNTEDSVDESTVPALSELSIDELEAVELALLSEYEEKRGATVELSADAVTELTDIVEAIELVREEAANRAAVSALDDIVAAGSVREFAAEDDANDDSVAEVEETEDEETVTTTEVAEDAPAISPDGLEGDKPDVSEAPVLVASIATDVPGYTAGTRVSGLRGVSEALISKHKRLRGNTEAGRVFDVVASIEAEYPENRIFTDDPVKNAALAEAVAGTQAIVASGGICVPLTPYYNLFVLGDVDRPIRDALPSFKADRGGIRYMTSPKLSDLSGSVRVTTEAEDAAGYTTESPAGTTAPKPSLKVDCGDEVAVTIDAISRSLTFGNFGARTYPEQVEAWTKLSLVTWARTAETYLLDKISAASTAVTATATYSATRSILPQIDVAVAAYKSRHRIATGVNFRAFFPEWVKGLIRTDLARQAFQNELSVSDAQITEYFRVRGINPTFYHDTRTGAGQVFGAQGAGALLAFPTVVEWYLFQEGSFLHLDGGALDLGVVRDSTLNSQNNFQIFAETFETVAFVGQESLRVRSTVCPDGTAPAGVSAITC